MSSSTRFESLFKYLFLISASTAGTLHIYKDAWPEPSFYDLSSLESPVQTETARDAFAIEANGLQYTIHPKFDYELYGVIVSYSNADGFTNIWHHKRWQDFINVRDLCVIWGNNIESGVYRQMKFNSDSWTCWAYWPNRETAAQFTMNALSNNHLVTDNDRIKAALMQAEPGDLIRIKGVLAEYVNPAGGYTRGTSTTREDTGQGACETIYVDEFAIVQKAHPTLRKFANFFKGLSIISFLIYLGLFILAPPKPRYRQT